MMVTSNDGKSFQTGCGYDPLDTGCCYETPVSGTVTYTCSRCANAFRLPSLNNFTCLPGGRVSAAA
jgi:hypothetical protein